MNKNDDIKSIGKDDNYMLWLEEYLDEHDIVVLPLVGNGIINKWSFDEKNISRLSSLFSAINRYDLDKGSFFTYTEKSDGFTFDYYLKFKDNFYRVSLLYENNGCATCFCYRDDSADKYIDFDDIKNYFIMKETDFIKKQIVNYKELIKYLKNIGVPSDCLEDEIRKIYSR